MKKKKTRLEKIEKTLSKGKQNFVLKYGVFGWGLIVGIIFAIGGSFNTNGEFKVMNLALKGIPALIIFPIGGIWWGNKMWDFLGKQREKLKNSEESLPR